MERSIELLHVVVRGLQSPCGGGEQSAHVEDNKNKHRRPRQSLQALEDAEREQIKVLVDVHETPQADDPEELQRLQAAWHAQDGQSHRRTTRGGGVSMGENVSTRKPSAISPQATFQSQGQNRACHQLPLHDRLTAKLCLLH